MKPNSVKAYGKPGVPRVEAAINNAREFKEKKGVFNEAGEFVKRQWVPMGKGIPRMPRRLEVGKACSNRLVGELDGIVPRGDAIKGIPGNGGWAEEKRKDKQADKEAARPRASQQGAKVLTAPSVQEWQDDNLVAHPDEGGHVPDGGRAGKDNGRRLIYTLSFQ